MLKLLENLCNYRTVSDLSVVHKVTNLVIGQLGNHRYLLLKNPPLIWEVIASSPHCENAKFELKSVLNKRVTSET